MQLAAGYHPCAAGRPERRPPQSWDPRANAGCSTASGDVPDPVLRIVVIVEGARM
jgi:hypothetical protein